MCLMGERWEGQVEGEILSVDSRQTRERFRKGIAFTEAVIIVLRDLFVVNAVQQFVMIEFKNYEMKGIIVILVFDPFDAILCRCSIDQSFGLGSLQLFAEKTIISSSRLGTKENKKDDRSYSAEKEVTSCGL